MSPMAEVEDAVKEMCESIHSLVVVLVLLVCCVFLIVCIECAGLVRWLVDFNKNRKKSSEEKPTVAISVKKKDPSKKKGNKGPKANRKKSSSSKPVSNIKSRGKTPFPAPSRNRDEKEVQRSVPARAAAIEPLSILYRDQTITPCHPTTRSAEAHNERSMKVVRDRAPIDIGQYAAKKKTTGAKDVQVHFGQGPQPMNALKPPKKLSKEEYRQEIRDILRARRRMLGDLQEPAPTTEEENLKPIYKTAEIRIDMPEDGKSGTAKKKPKNSIKSVTNGTPKQKAGSEKASNSKSNNNATATTVGDADMNDAPSKKAAESQIKPTDEAGNRGADESKKEATEKKEAAGTNFPYGSPV